MATTDGNERLRVAAQQLKERGATVILRGMDAEGAGTLRAVAPGTITPFEISALKAQSQRLSAEDVAKRGCGWLGLDYDVAPTELEADTPPAKTKAKTKSKRAASAATKEDA